MGTIFGDKWTRQIDGDELLQIAMIQWLEGLNGYTKEEIQTGIERCRDCGDYSITLARFKFLSKGLIDVPMAYEFALKEDFRILPIKWAYNKCGGSWVFKNLPEEMLRRKFVANYESICIDIIQNKISANNQDIKVIEHSPLSEKQIWLKSMKERYPMHYQKHIANHPEDATIDV